MNVTYLHCSRGGGTWEFCCCRGGRWVCCALHGLCLSINYLSHRMRVADDHQQDDYFHHLRRRRGVVHRLWWSRLAQIGQLWPLQHHLMWKCKQLVTEKDQQSQNTIVIFTSFCETREFMTGMSIGATMGVTGGGDESRVTEAWKEFH